MRWLVLAAAAISLSGCGLPPTVTYTSYVADIFSYLSTKKSVTDHGISFVLQKDCALLRVFDGPICIEEVAEVVLSDCARFEASHDTVGPRDGSGAGDDFMRRPREVYDQIILRDAGEVQCDAAALGPLGYARVVDLDTSDPRSQVPRNHIQSVALTKRRAT